MTRWIVGMAFVLLVGLALSGCAGDAALEAESAERGFQGAVGPAGPAGAQGEPGPPGPPGVSAAAPEYAGTEKCKACHPDVYAKFALSGHNYALNAVVDGQPPQYPLSQLPGPPAGATWDGVSYVVGGYARKARFVDADGFLITGADDARTQYNLPNPELGLGDEWVAYHPDEQLRYDCGSCHSTGYNPYQDTDALPEAFGVWAADGVQCEACHGPGSMHVADPEKGLIEIDPNAELCQRCHLPGTAETVEAADGFILHHDDYPDIYAGRKDMMDCVDCHDPHLGVTAARQQGLPTHTPCEACHLDQAAPAAGDVHPPMADCVDCHMPRLIKSAVADPDAHSGDMRVHLMHISSSTLSQVDESGAMRPFIALDAACKGCHSESGVASTQPDNVLLAVAAGYDHQQNSHVNQVAGDCTGCHDPAEWTEATLKPALHTLIGTPLTGAHLEADCQSCHANGSFAGTPEDCVACHAAVEPHQGQFGQDCGDCHQSTAWQEVAFDHAASSFQLVGAHAAATCSDCHAGRTYQETPADCASCHAAADAHQGQFGSDCAACHTPAGWSGATFDHAQAGFQLVGLHQQAACTGCHGGGTYAGTPQDCATCHAGADAHQGRFGQNCAGCHTPAGWGQATFDHARAAFALTGAHTQVACTSCHAGDTYQGTPQACVACHGEPGLHAGRFGTDCTACHTTSGWRPAAYNGPHAFPTGHGGAGGNCASCHPSGLLSYSCFGCHNQGDIIGEHQEEGIGSPDNCVSCHPSGQEPGDDHGDDGGDDDHGDDDDHGGGDDDEGGEDDD